MNASRRKANAVREKVPRILASRRQRTSQANGRSTIHLLGSTTKPLAGSERLTISSRQVPERLGGGRGGRSLVAAIGKEALDKRKQPACFFEQRQGATSILSAVRMNLGSQHEAKCVDDDVALALDFAAARPLAGTCPRHTPMDRYPNPLFCALDTLAVDDRNTGAGFLASQLAGLHVERMVEARLSAVPELKILVHRAPGRQILGQGAPLAAGGQDVENAVHHLAHVHRAFAPVVLGRRDQRLDQRLFRIRQIARLAQAGALVHPPVLDHPHRTPPSVPDR